MPAIYRVWQFLQAAEAWVRPAGEAETLARRYLPPVAVGLFRSLPRYDRQHGLRVVLALQRLGHNEEDLLAAALLHDAGKAARSPGRLRLWHRVAAVLMRAAHPCLVERVGRDRPGSWRHPFYVQQHHAAIGAELAREAGCSPRTVELIRRHEDAQSADDPWLAALQKADSEN